MSESILPGSTDRESEVVGSPEVTAIKTHHQPPAPRLQAGHLLPGDVEILGLWLSHGSKNLYHATNGHVPLVVLEVENRNLPELEPCWDLAELLPALPHTHRVGARAYAYYPALMQPSLKEVILPCDESLLVRVLYRLLLATEQLAALGVDPDYLAPGDVFFNGDDPHFLIYPYQSATDRDPSDCLSRLVNHVLFNNVLPKATRNLADPLEKLRLSQQFEGACRRFLDDGDREPFRVFLKLRLAEPEPDWDGFGLTHTGLVREHNEDAFGWQLGRMQSYYQDGQQCLLAVSDGMGGHQLGEKASHLALQAFFEYLNGRLEPGERENPLLSGLVSDAFEEAGNRVRTAFSQVADNEKPGATLVAGLLSGRDLFLGNCGDSRAYLYTPQRGLCQVTQDHSLVQLYVQRGMLTLEESEECDNHVITNFVGIDEKSYYHDHYRVHLPPASWLLLCSDGLTDMVRTEEIAQILASSTRSDEAARRLRDMALSHGGHDNISVLIFHDVALENQDNLQDPRPASSGENDDERTV